MYSTSKVDKPVEVRSKSTSTLCLCSDKYKQFTIVSMAKFDGVKGQELLDVEESDKEITLIFKDNRFLFVRLEGGRIACESVPE